MAFRGWTDEAIRFFEELEVDNTKAFWLAHKDVYEEQVRAPMRALLDDLEEEFGRARMFRPYRDTRFSADKSPYKTTIAAELERGGYVQFSAAGLGVGAGSYHLAPDQLDRYRGAVAADRTGREIAGIVATLRRDGYEVMAHDSLKTAPRGYPKDHPRLELLRLKGLAVWRQLPASDWLGSSKAPAKVTAALRSARPLTAWLEAYVGPSRLPPR
ncbi:MAG TPA: DUF2461 domain-containing protein [Actinomycetes bacterium]|nr:DUF2461 domain-containing protein [Actinomycetes bacterium]